MVDLITPQKALAVARGGGALLAELVEPDGRFLYRYMLPDPSIRDAVYSNERHIGALWAMLDWEREEGFADGLSEAINTAAGYMTSSILQPYGSTDFLCVGDEGVIKLGGPAVGTVVSVGLHRRTGDAAHLDRATRLAGYVASQRQSDGDFVHIRIPGRISRPHPTRSDMYTGQAVLGLTILSEATGDISWIDLAFDSARKLAAHDHGVAGQSHWMLYAVEALHRSRPEVWLLDYALRIATSIMSDTSFRASLESTPVACRTEGLLAFARLAAATGDDYSEALKHIRRNLRRQLKFHDRSGAFVRSLQMPEVRIDYIVHNVIGFLGYYRIASHTAV